MKTPSSTEAKALKRAEPQRKLTFLEKVERDINRALLSHYRSFDDWVAGIRAEHARMADPKAACYDVTAILIDVSSL